MSDATTATEGKVWAAQIFLISLAVPYFFNVGSLVLMPHRLVLLILFIPFFLRLFIFRAAGPILLADWLMFGSAVWAGAAFIANHGVPYAIEPLGVHMLEFFGAYLVARVAIRSASDFKRVVRTLFLMTLLLVPFAAMESLTRGPFLLDLLPATGLASVETGDRWGMRRAQTIFAHPIHLGVFVSTCFGLFWYGLRPRWARVPSVIVTLLGTVFSLSTGALISYVVQSGFIAWETILKTIRQRWRLFTVLAVLGYVTIDLLSNRTPFHVLVTYASFSTISAYARINIFNFGMENVWANPIFGLGHNDWARPIWLGESVDNYWLLLTMQLGLPAIIMIFVALTHILFRVSKANIPNEDDNLCRAAYLVAFGGLFIAGCTVHYWHAMMAFAMFVFGTGVWAATGGASVSSTTSETMPEPRYSRYTRQPTIGAAIPRHAATGGTARFGRALRRPSRTSS